MRKEEIELYVEQKALQMGVNLEVIETEECINHNPPSLGGFVVRAYTLKINNYKEVFIGCDYEPSQIKPHIDRVLDNYMSKHKDVKERYMKNRLYNECFKKEYGLIKL